MEQLLLRTSAAIEDCDRHLASSGAFGTEIEAYLTQYLAVIMCADVQQELYRLADERAAVAGDSALSSFVAASMQKILRSVSKKEISMFVEMFGPECKTRLNGTIADDMVTLYNNAVLYRHTVAHKNAGTISFRELKEAVNAAKKLLTATAASIALPQPETVPPTPPA